MNNQYQQDPRSGKPESGELSAQGSIIVEPRRRRLVGGAAAGVGVLLAVQAKTALGAGVCQSPSAAISGNASPRPGDDQCSGGRSPGFWKEPQKFQYWGPAGATPPTFKPGVIVRDCASGMQNLSNADIQTPGTLVSTVLPGAPVDANTGIWSVLAFPTLYEAGQLMRHLVAAWLNAGYFTSGAEKYPITRQQILDMWYAVRGGGIYCPGSVAPCGSQGMTAQDVIDYISGMYDVNSVIEHDICKEK